MDFDDNDDNLFTLEIEWTIENFSCWDAESHGSVIDCPDTLPDFKVSLQHQRTPMIDAPMTISCFFGKHRPWDGEVTFLGADQSILGAEKIRAMGRDRVTVPAPDLSSAAEELEDHGDFVTLRFRFAAPERENILFLLNTKIDVLSDISTKFSRSELLNDIASLERKLLMAFVYNNNDSERVEVHLERVLYRTSSDMLPIIYLELRPASDFAFKNVIVKCYTDLFDDAGTLLRSDSFCRAFKTTNDLGLQPWPIAHSLTQDLLSCRDCFVHLRIRFVTGTIEGYESSVVSGLNISSVKK